jgi:hypothetical protein
MITEGDWERLDVDLHAHGATVRRIYPQSPHDIFIAVRHSDTARMLMLRVSVRAAAEGFRRLQTLPRTQGLEMQFARHDDTDGELRVILTSSDLREVFNPLASDIAATAAAQSSASEAVLAAVERFEHWRRMLQTLTGTGLSPAIRRGLFGELAVLRDHLLSVMDAVDAVSAWTGPLAANQDFQLPVAAVEVKTSSGKEPQTLVINNERELDGNGTRCLILAHISLDERRGGSGETLNDAVDRTRAATGSPTARTLLDDLLIRVGYLQQQRDLYDEPRYTIRKQHFWQVEADFPRITEADLRPGVGDCEYHISTAGLDRFLITAEQLKNTVTGEASE